MTGGMAGNPGGSGVPGSYDPMMNQGQYGTQGPYGMPPSMGAFGGAASAHPNTGFHGGHSPMGMDGFQ